MLRKCAYNSIIGYLNISSLRYKIIGLRHVLSQVNLIFYIKNEKFWTIIFGQKISDYILTCFGQIKSEDKLTILHVFKTNFRNEVQ